MRQADQITAFFDQRDWFCSIGGSIRDFRSSVRYGAIGDPSAIPRPTTGAAVARGPGESRSDTRKFDHAVGADNRVWFQCIIIIVALTHHLDDFSLIELWDTGRDLAGQTLSSTGCGQRRSRHRPRQGSSCGGQPGHIVGSFGSEIARRGVDRQRQSRFPAAWRHLEHTKV